MSTAAPSHAGLRKTASAFGGFVIVTFLTFVGLMAITFFIGRVIPIDPVLAVVGDRATQEQYDAARIAMGLDQPLVVQFITYVGDVFQGDLGHSVSTNRPVAEDLARVFPATLEMATLGIIIGVGMGVPLGVWAAARQGTWIDQLIRVFALLGYSVPAFWLGLVGLVVFYAGLGWVGGPGRVDIFYEGLVEPYTGLLLVDALIAGDMDVFWSALDHLILPATILGFFSLAYIARMTRSFMLDQLGQEYITTARVKGVAEWRVIWTHGFRPIRVPLITVIGLSYAALLEGSVMIETVFSWPGIGNYLTVALLNADMNAVLGATLVIGSVFILINKLSDVLYRILDPRSRQEGAMTTMTNWLLDDSPSSRLQASLGHSYRVTRMLMRNPLAVVGALILLVLILAAIFAPWIAPHSPLGQNLGQRLLPPSAAHWMGTDELGRDIFSRVIYGARITLLIVALVAVISAPLGLLIGAVSGYFGGWTDKIIMGVTDVFLSMPKLILALAFVAALGPGIENAIVAIAITSWPAYARIARAETLTFRNSEFISAMRLLGASHTRIITGHVLPLCTSSMIVRVTLDMAGIILTAAGLGFLGLGAQPPLPEWGAMISRGRAFILDQWWVATMPGFAIIIVSLGFCFLGDGLRDVLDPKQGGKS